MNRTNVRATALDRNEYLRALARATFRKRLLVERELQLHRTERLGKAWQQVFAKHDFWSASLIQVDPLSTEPWRQAAREYHQTRGNRVLIVGTSREHAKRRRKLIADPSVSLEHMLDEFGRTRPTRRSTVEAVWLDVRERGIAALGEPGPAKRWQRCDEAARAEILTRVARLVERKP
jgi:hypothetical protein